MVLWVLPPGEKRLPLRGVVMEGVVGMRSKSCRPGEGMLKEEGMLNCDGLPSRSAADDRGLPLPNRSAADDRGLPLPSRIILSPARRASNTPRDGDDAMDRNTESEDLQLCVI